MLSPEVLRPTEHCTVGCALLDGLLRGGVAAASLTELTGESTAGKTQLCLQLLLAVQLPVSEGGLGGRAVYIHTEGRAQMGRLAAIARARFPQLPSPCDLVLVANASAGPEQLVDAVKQTEALCADAALSPPVRLVIVDSLTFPFRDLDVGAPGQAAQRSELLYSLSSRLKALAQTWRVAVVVTNHVVDCVDHGSSSLLALEQATGGLPLLSSGRRVMPALGLHWANCVSTRLFMSRDTRAGALASEAEVTRRMRVVFSPHLPAAECRFAVRATGVSGVEPEPGEEPIA